ncbi:MAG: PQQ-dependent sugar dehydrogenase [Omnitrophica WOR_2 bacterium]
MNQEKKDFTGIQSFISYPFIVFGAILSLILITFTTRNTRLAAAASPSAFAWPSISLQTYASGFNKPVFITNAKDGSGRIFIVEQPGRIRIIKNGQIQATDFLDISDRVLYSGEEGLLGLAFPPDFSARKYFYVYYTGKDQNNRVSRFRVGADGNGIAASEELIILIKHPNYTNHNGGQLAFGPDGYLYIGTGDGGGAGDPQGNAQNLGSLLGKILRIDTEKSGQNTNPAINLNILFLPFMLNSSINPPAPPYQIPPTNPFINKSGARPEIWAYGMRNPWRFSFDAQTGNLYIADVGQGLYEEIDFQPAGSSGGLNYGWNIMEGLHCYNAATCNTSGLTLPVWEYPHGTNNTNGCAVIGGYVYHGNSFPAMQGIYFYGDYCSGNIWGLVNSGGSWQGTPAGQPLLKAPFQISSFGLDETGNLYLSDLTNGKIYRITSP